MAFQVTRVVLFLSGLLGTVFCSNILLFPLAGDGTHYHVMLRIANTLLHRGHNITLLVTDRYVTDITSSLNPTEQSIKFIFSPSAFTMEEWHDVLTEMTVAGLKGRYFEWLMTVLSDPDSPLVKNIEECNGIITNEKILSTLRDSKFDLTVVDHNQGCPVHQYLHKYMDVPYVSMSAVMTIPHASNLDNRVPFNPSYIPEMLSALSDKMSYRERFKNVVTSLFFVVLLGPRSDPYSEMRLEFGLPSIYCEDAELFLINTHFALDFPRPLLPNIKTVGGLTTGKGRPLSVVSKDS